MAFNQLVMQLSIVGVENFPILWKTLGQFI